MVISKIEKQKKNRKRVSIFIDGEFECGVTEDSVVKFGLKSGDDISRKKLTEIIDFDEYLYAKKSAFDFLSYRLRSEREIKDKLKNKKISSKTIVRTIDHLRELGLLNDEEFTKQVIQNYITGKPKGKNFIKQKLFQKGVSRQISEKILEEVFTDVNEKQIILEVFDKYSKKLQNYDNKEKKRKIFAYLAGKGFDFDLINQVIYEKLK